VRIRQLRPQLWDDRGFARATQDEDGNLASTLLTRLVYAGMWNLADEHCRLPGDPVWIKGQLFPYDADVTPDMIAASIRRLAHGHRIGCYEHDGDPYLVLLKLCKNAALEPWKSKSRYPAPPAGLYPPCPCHEGGRELMPWWPPVPAGYRKKLGLPSPGAASSEVGADQSPPRSASSEVGADQSPPRADQSTLYRGSGVGSREVGTRAAGLPSGYSAAAESLLRDHALAMTPRPLSAVLDALASHVEALLAECPADEISAGLAMLRSRPDLGPGVLPHLVNEVRQRRAVAAEPPDTILAEVIALHPDPARRRAQEAWARAIASGGKPQKMLEAYRAYAGTCPDKRYQAQPATWLDDERWRTGTGAGDLNSRDQAELDRQIDQALMDEAHSWPDDPGEANQARRDLIAEVTRRYHAERAAGVRQLRATGGVA
jgi:hypothetical protein